MNQTINPNSFLRLSQIVGRQASTKNPTKYPAIPGLLPISASAWWAGVKAGRFPAGVKLGPKTTAWRAADVFALVAGQPVTDRETGK